MSIVIILSKMSVATYYNIIINSRLCVSIFEHHGVIKIKYINMSMKKVLAVFTKKNTAFLHCVVFLTMCFIH